MDPAPIRRWNLGFVIMRWRHLFWGVPLLGLLVGLVLHFLPMMEKSVNGIVELRSLTTGNPLSGASHLDTVIKSDALLRPTVTALDLPRHWQMASDDCVNRLRERIQIEPIRGTTLLGIRVKGRSRAESRQIWETLATSLNEHFNRSAGIQDQTKLERLNAELERQEADVESDRQALTMAMQYQDLLFRTESLNPAPLDKTERLRIDFETSARVRDQMKIRITAEEMRLKIASHSLIIHEFPTAPLPISLWNTLRSLVVHSFVGTGVGIVLAVIFAYLLEFGFQRKTAFS
jgi:hypothetical protein